MQLKEYDAATGEPTAQHTDAPVHSAILPAEPDSIMQLPLERVHASATNPRRTYNAAAMAELVASVRQAGVLQPVLVRPHPGRVHDWQLVYGHRRLKAAQEAGLATIPAMACTYSDQQAAQAQAVENLQREDLTALDEAQGYAAYIAAHGITKDELAERIGKSRTHVYNRLKLATLAPDVAQALMDGKIQAEVATLIARVPERHQVAALKTVLENAGHWIFDKPSVRKARELLVEKYTLDLREAIFDTADFELLPLAGACSACPKRSGNTPELYADLVDGVQYRHTATKGSANICTDPDCFAEKKKAHLALKAKALRDKGATVVTGSAARAAVDAYGNLKEGYVALKDAKAALAKIKAKPGQEAPVLPTVVTIQDPRGGKTQQAVKLADLQAAAGTKVTKPAAKKPADQDSYALERARRAKAAEERATLNLALLEQVRAAAATRERAAWEARLVATALWALMHWTDKAVLAKVHGFERPEELGKRIAEMDAPNLAAFLLDCALIEDVRCDSYGVGGNQPAALITAATQYGIELPKIYQPKAAKTKSTTTTQPNGATDEQD